MSYTTLYNQYINFQDPEDQVSDMLDTLQHTEQEYQALQDLIYHTHTSKDTDEYEPFNQGIMIGGFDKDVQDEEYFRILDRNEMRGDMFSFEDENKSHELFAENTWEDRSFHLDYHIVSKKSEVTIDATVTKVGTDYSTATSEYGKIFIPRPCGLNLPIGDYTDKTITVRARFQGFDGCRKAAMPWRAIAIINQ